MSKSITELNCNRIRKYQLLVVLFALYVPLIGPITIGLYILLHHPIVPFVIAAAWMAAFFFVVVALVFFRCPNCKRRFWGRWVFAKKCRHCGFQLIEDCVRAQVA